MPSTRWSVVAAVNGPNSVAARTALERLCQSYWYPLYAFLRGRGHTPEDAQDLTQGFFADLIAKDRLDHVDQAKGRFRSFLLKAIQHYASDSWDRARAQKRGGQVETFSLDAAPAEERYKHEPVDDLTPEEIHDRRWAITVLQNAAGQLEGEFRDAGKSGWFEALRGFLTEKSTEGSYAQVARRIGATEDAVRCAVQRLRRRYADLIRHEVADTLASPTRDQVDEEVRYLLSIVGRRE